MTKLPKEVSEYNIFNNFSVFEENSVEDSIVNEELNSVNFPDTLSLDSQGQSWADMNDDYDDIPSIYKKNKSDCDKLTGFSQSDENNIGFTKVLSKKSLKKKKENNGINIKCRGCYNMFFFTQNKIDDYNSRGWNIPKTCKSCGDKKRNGVFFRHGPKQRVNLD